MNFPNLLLRTTILLASVMVSRTALGQKPEPIAQSLPILILPDKKIAEVYRGNWVNTLLPCRTLPPPPATNTNVHADPERPWKVDVNGHYPGWYPGVDVKHMAAAYLACEKNLPLVLRAWDLTVSKYLMPDGGVRPMTMFHSPHNVPPEQTVDGSVVFYPLRMTANIDLVLLGDMIYRFSQDKAWLAQNLPHMRKAAKFIEGWIDDDGLLHSDSYDLDQVYREIDGVAQASAISAFRKLAALESVGGEKASGRHASGVAGKLSRAGNTLFWDPTLGYYSEHLAYNNLAHSARLDSVMAVSSELDADHAVSKAIDGVIGRGIDAFGVGKGAAGKHEWAAKNETVGAWIKIGLAQPTKISKVILINRTDPNTKLSDRFAEGYLEFSDGSQRVNVKFNALDVSRAVASFSPRNATWVKFTGTRMQGEGGGSAGLSEFMMMPADAPYRRFTHGMTDTNFAMVAFGEASKEHADLVWKHFKANEAAFYEVNGLRAPTWIAEKAISYGQGDLNKRAPRKDCVAMGRTWRYDALMRQRLGDGEGIYNTITYANILYDRPSGGGVGVFSERYGLGRFQPGDEGQATVPAYSEYPAVYNSTVVQQTLLGLDVDVWGTIHIDPCVPRDWYTKGFGQEGCGVLKDHDLGFTYRFDRVEGWVTGPSGKRKLRLRLPPQIEADKCLVRSNGKPIRHTRLGRYVAFNLSLANGVRTAFTVEKED